MAGTLIVDAMLCLFSSCFRFYLFVCCPHATAACLSLFVSSLRLAPCSFAASSRDWSDPIAEVLLPARMLKIVACMSPIPRLDPSNRVLPPFFVVETRRRGSCLVEPKEFWKPGSQLCLQGLVQQRRPGSVSKNISVTLQQKESCSFFCGLKEKRGASIAHYSDFRCWTTPPNNLCGLGAGPNQLCLSQPMGSRTI